jgi:hypothetical protein
MASASIFITDPALEGMVVAPDPTSQTAASNAALGYAFSSGTATLLAGVAGDTLTVNGVTFTCVAAATVASQVQYNVGATDIITATNLCNAVRNHGQTGGTVQNASPATSLPLPTGPTSSNLSNGVTANNAAGTSAVVTFTAAFYGTSGNNITLAQTGAHWTLSGGTLTGGLSANPSPAIGSFSGTTVVAGNTAVVQGVTFTAIAAGIPTAIQFNVASTDAGTMANLASAINAHPHVSALVAASIGVGSTVAVVTSRQIGTVGNTIAASSTGGITTTAFAGGVNYVNQNNNSRMRENIDSWATYLRRTAGGLGYAGTGLPSGGGVGGSVSSIAIGTGTQNFAFATGTLTVAAPAAGATATINGVVFTGGAGTTGDLQFNVTGTNVQIAQSLADAINKTANVGVVGIATASTGGTAVVTVSAAVPGKIGNAVSLAGTAVTLAASGAALAGGAGGERPAVSYVQ